MTDTHYSQITDADRGRDRRETEVKKERNRNIEKYRARLANRKMERKR